MPPPYWLLAVASHCPVGDRIAADQLVVASLAARQSEALFAPQARSPAEEMATASTVRRGVL
jgi:hypothetical protein